MAEHDISLYDKYDYDYTAYWEGRTYEHEAEAMALHKMLSGQAGNWFVDIGGSFGRHVPQYYQRFHNCIIADYSIKALKQADTALRDKKITNVVPIAANAYNLPFRDSAFDGAMMVRVMHHLEKPEDALSEISRILGPGGVFILEFANKIHLKSLFRAFLTLDWTYPFSIEPVDVSSGHHEGSKNGVSGIMKNYHPKHAKNLVVSQETKCRRSVAISFFRIPFLKRIAPNSLLIRAERLMQFLFGWLPLTPSIMYEVHSTKHPPDNKIRAFSGLDELLVCPKCKNGFLRKSGSYFCQSCTLTFSRTEGILDLRYPVVTE